MFSQKNHFKILAAAVISFYGLYLRFQCLNTRDLWNDEVYQFDSMKSSTPLWEYKVVGKAVAEKFEGSAIYDGFIQLNVDVEKTTVTLLSKSLAPVEHFLMDPGISDHFLPSKCLKVGVPFDLMKSRCGFFLPPPTKRAYAAILLSSDVFLFDEISVSKRMKPGSISIYPLVKKK